MATVALVRRGPPRVRTLRGQRAQIALEAARDARAHNDRVFTLPTAPSTLLFAHGVRLQAGAQKVAQSLETI